MKEPTLQQQKQKFLEEKFLELEGRKEKENLSYKFSRSMNAFIEDAREQGYHDMGKLNKMVADQIANQALNFREKDILDFIYEIKTTNNANYGQTNAGQNLIRTVGDRIDQQEEEDEERAYRRKRRQKEDQLEAFGVELGELRNKRNEEGYEEGLSNIVERLNSAGFTSQAESVLSYEDKVKQRQEKEDTITFGSDEVDSLLRIYQREGRGGFLTHILENGLKIDTQLRDSILGTDGNINDLSSISFYNDSLKDIQKSLDNIGNAKIQDFLKLKQLSPEESITFQKPTEYFNKLGIIKSRIGEALHRTYRKIAFADGGKRQFREFNEDQRKAFFEMLRLDLEADDPNSAGFIMREGQKELMEIMDNHLNSDKRSFLNKQKDRTESKDIYKILFDTDTTPTTIDPLTLLLQYRKQLKILQAKKSKGKPFLDVALEDYLEEDSDISISFWEDLDTDTKGILNVKLTQLNDRILRLLTPEQKKKLQGSK